MAKAVKKQVEIDFYTWEEFVEYGRKTSPDSIHDGFAWHFNFEGYNISHENNECYIIPTLEGNHHFTPNDVLIKGVKGELYPCKKDIFEMTYDVPKKENSFFERLLIEAQELAAKTNALNDFMRTQKFVDLDRQNKDLLYKQSRLMNEYLQVLGQRIELIGGKFSFPN